VWLVLDPSNTGQLIALIILLAFSAFFSASETALISIGKIRVRHLVEEKVKGAGLVARLLDSPSKLISTILVGNNVVNIAASALATAIAIRMWGSAGVGIATGVMTLLVLIFGEITPKTIAAQYPEKVVLRVARPIYWIMLLLTPVVKVFTFITNAFIKTIGGEVHRVEPYITEEEIRTMVSVGQEEGVIETEEKEMIHNIFEFNDTYVKEIMVPRPDIVGIENTTSFEELIEVVKEEQFSRIPVYEATIDNIIGIIYVKDLFVLSAEEREQFDPTKYMRKAYYIPEFKKVGDLFNEFRHQKIHMAVVVDEYGGTAGIITMEDIIEEIVGEIADEYDMAELPQIQTIDDRTAVADAGLRINEVNELLGLNLPSEESDTLGGFVFNLFGRIPLEQERIVYQDIEFVVEEMEKHRIQKVKLIKL